MRFSFLTYAYNLFVGIPEHNAVREAGIFVLATKDADDNGLISNFKGRHQAATCLTGLTGLHANSILTIKFAVLIEQLIGTDPGIALAADISQIQAIVTHVSTDDVIVQSQFRHSNHIIEAGIVGTHMETVRIGKMRLFKA